MPKLPLISLVALLALSPAMPAWAASARSVLDTSGLSGLTCAQFSRMLPSRRDALVQRANLASPSTLAPLLAPRVTGRNGTVGQGRSYSLSQTPLQSGTIISACQAAPPRSTIGDAFSHAHTMGAVRL